MVGEPVGSPFTDDVEIGGDEELLVEPEKLPYPPLYAVTHHGDTDFSADGDSQSRVIAPTHPPEDDEMCSADLHSGIGYAEIVPSFPDPFTGGKGSIHITYLQAICTESLLRPFARLLLMTSLPFLVDMRTRKPWVLLRDMLLG
jgi:hypothetical protein